MIFIKPKTIRVHALSDVNYSPPMNSNSILISHFSRNALLDREINLDVNA